MVLVLCLTGCPAALPTESAINPAGIYVGTIIDGDEQSTVAGLATAGGDVRLRDLARGISLRVTFAPFAHAEAEITAMGQFYESGHGEVWVEEGHTIDLESSVSGDLPPHPLSVALDREPISDAWLPMEALVGEWLGDDSDGWVEISPSGDLLAYDEASGCSIEGYLADPENGAAGMYRFMADLSCPDGFSRGTVLLGLLDDQLILGLVHQGLPSVFTAR